MAEDPFIYKITPSSAWELAIEQGVFSGAPIDIDDGYIHFSTAEQAAETAAKHFAGQTDLLLVAVRIDDLGSLLKWEISRGGALFPHLYATLSLEAVEWSRPMPVGEDGVHMLPLGVE